MARTEVNNKQIKDGGVWRDDLNILTTGQAVVRKIIQGTNITISSTGVDSGTGDVTVNLDLSAANTNEMLYKHATLGIVGNDLFTHDSAVSQTLQTNFTNFYDTTTGFKFKLGGAFLSADRSYQMPDNGGLIFAATSVAQGDLFYGSALNVFGSLAKDTNATRYVSNTGTSNNPAWAQVNLTNGVTGILPVANGGSGAGAFTLGSVVFAGASGVYTQDNANFFWDDTNNRLGIGTTTPQQILHLHSGAANNTSFLVTNNNTGQAATDGFYFGYTNQAFVWNYENTAISFATNNQEKIRLSATGGFSLGATYVSTNPGAGGMILSGKLGVGVLIPTGKVTIDFPSAVVNAADTLANLSLRSTTAMGIDIGPQMQFSGYIDGSLIYGFGTIAGRKENASSGDYKGYLQFSTEDNVLMVEAMRLTSGRDMGVGATAPSARVHIIKTTEQLRVGYDTSNYFSTSVGSAGAVIFNAVGSGSTFNFSDDVGIGGTPLQRLTVYSSAAGTNVIQIYNSVGSAIFSMADISGNGQFVVRDAAGAAKGVFNTASDSYFTGGKVGFGTSTVSAQIHTLSTTEQLRVGYDASNYYSTTVGSTGGVTFNAVGAGSAFTFSDAVTINGSLTLSAQNIITDTTTGMKIGTSTTQKLAFHNATPIVQDTGWTITNQPASLRTFDYLTMTGDEFVRAFITLVEVFKAKGLIGA